MALLDSELQLIRAELHFPVVEVGAEPYIGVAAVFQSVIRPYLSAGAKTTSSTTVAAASTPTAASLVLASATGFSEGQTIVVDVDGLQERTTVRAISGATISTILSLAHTGTYPVTVEGGESIVRDILGNIRDIKIRIGKARGRAGIKKVEDIEFFGNNDGKSATLSSLVAEREYWRRELWATLFGDGDHAGGAHGSVCENY